MRLVYDNYLVNSANIFLFLTENANKLKVGGSLTVSYNNSIVSEYTVGVYIEVKYSCQATCLYV